MENEKKINVEKITANLIGLSWNKTSDGTPIVCAITSNDNLHTKTTSRSYLTALVGAAGAKAYVKSKLDIGQVEILSGSKITWERTTVPAGLPHERSGETVVLDDDDIIDHIIAVDLQPIAGVLLEKYLDDYMKEHPNCTISSLQEKLMLKNFGVQVD